MLDHFLIEKKTGQKLIGGKNVIQEWNTYRLIVSKKLMTRKVYFTISINYSDCSFFEHHSFVSVD